MSEELYFLEKMEEDSKLPLTNCHISWDKLHVTRVSRVYVAFSRKREESDSR